MGYPHPPHPKETVVLSKHFGDAEARTFEGWVTRGGYEGLKKALGMTPEQIIEEVKASGLRGRGGAGFPTGLKWSFVPKNDGKPHYLVCNADESEPGTFKDREIMRWTPHGLIEGVAIAAYAIGSERAYIYIRGEFTEPWRIMSAAVEEAYRHGALGGNVFGTGKRIDITLHRGAGAYICGEETALLNSIEGKRGNPRIKPPFPAIAGLFGMPTAVNNVETLAAVPHIILRGAAWYTGLCLGNPKSTGTKLVSICGHVQRPGNYEVTLGTPLKEILYDMAGGPRPGRRIKAVIPGGSSVPILTAEEADATIFDYEGVVAAGSMLGSAGMIVMDDTTDMVYQIMRLARFYAHESCAQCTQCREGTAWSTRILERILAGNGKPEDLELLLDLADNMTGKTICVLSDSCAAPIVSGIKKFRGEFEAYLKKLRQPALVAV
ncbi:MAG TPA: NADH-quinone oxidoreductase subunit NuoF [Gemmatimonadales bacterium]|nr:NADH-quinone oxidoreductase subunit NuoF [Gemmatimonadales bacterium]